MIRLMYRDQHGSLHTGLENLETALQDTAGLVWVDMAGELPQDCESILANQLKFHPLAIDDALKESHAPKIDDWGSYLYLVLHAVTFKSENGGPLNTLELDLFVGHNYLITHRLQAIPAVDRVWELCQRDQRHLQRGTGRLLYQVADELVADYMPVVEQIDEAIDRIEDQVFSRGDPQLLGEIFSLKRSLLHLRRIMGPQREVLNKLARGDFETIARQDTIFFRDVYDHLVRLHDIAESLRDLVGSALDTYLSVINNRMNDTMKTLTVITTLFMPVSFLVGFFGTNFFQPVAHLESWTDLTAFALMIAAIVLIPLGMFLWMRKRAWM